MLDPGDKRDINEYLDSQVGPNTFGDFTLSFRAGRFRLARNGVVTLYGKDEANQRPNGHSHQGGTSG